MNIFASRSTRARRQETQRTPISPSLPQREPPPPQIFSAHSTPAVPNSAWCSQDFMLGAGMVIIQPATEKVVVLYENVLKYWFLPKGRKDVGESLEQTALREAYEESGYRVEFLPLHTLSNAPIPPNSPPDARLRTNTEPIFFTTNAWPARRRQAWQDNGGEYLTMYYVGQIPENAVHEECTGMANEQDYSSHLMSIEEALKKLDEPEYAVVNYAWAIWKYTIKVEATRQALLEKRVTAAGSSRVDHEFIPPQNAT